MNDAGRIGFVLKGTFDNTATYDFLDVVYYNNATYVAKKLTVGNAPQNDNEFWQVLVDGEVDFNDITPTFSQAETRENINSGEKTSVLFGKIKKYFDDLKTIAFTGSYKDLSDKPEKKYGTLTVVNANGKEYSYVRTIGEEFGTLKITCMIPAIEAWGESVIYTSDIKPTNETVFCLIDQDTREAVRCLFNTSGQVIAQAKGKAFAGGWVGGSCVFM